MKKKDILNKFFSYFCKCLVIIVPIFLIVFNACAIKANIIPVKYIVLLIVISSLITLLFWYLLWKKHGIICKAISSLFALLLCLLFSFGIFSLNTTSNFLNSLISKEYESIEYNVVVLKSTNYSLNDLKNETLGMLDENSDNVIQELSNKISFNDHIASDLSGLINGLYNQSLKAIIVDNDTLEILRDTDVNIEVEDNIDEENIEDKLNIDFKNDTIVIYTFSVKTKVTNATASVVSANEPFAIYISGIDQYGSINTVRGRSDVNIIMIVNPLTNKILLVNTPRDYYVQLHNKPGLKDKLTHAGVYGIDLSLSTLEDLYDMKINYFLRVNFDTVIELVDVIDGIEVYSDTDFDSYHINGWHVNKGINYLDGKKALAYSRERYAYLTGDRHRGQNQQDVINAIIEKVSKSKVLLTKYNKILDSLEGSFQTNMPIDSIQNFIKYQLDKMPTWDVQSINVSGSDAYDYTYSYGTNQKLYVMVPYEQDILDAKKKIKDVLNDN